ncbi:MAG: LCP family protein [Trichococcus sp.]|uniref:LCP family glycopolymer transferase n=1 Tax=Trichococcus sp. TaxID=1985464 RepID=UPI003C46AB34
MNETRKGRQTKKRLLKGVLSVLLLGMVGTIAYVLKAYSDIGSTAESIFTEVSVVEKREESIEVETATQPISFLLLGADTGSAEEERSETGRSDTIIVCTVNPNTRTTTLLSLPRDTYTEIVGYSDVYDYYGDYYDKMNHAYAFGGTEMSINTVQEFLNIPIDYYVEVNFDGLTEIVDAVGGIEITSPLTFDFYGPQFIEGETRIFTGFEALQFSRMRKQDPEGDLGRQKRQQMVIKAILDKVLTMGTVVNYKDILTTVENNVQMNISLDEIISIASGYRKSLETFQQYYVEGQEVYIDEIYYYYVNPEERLRLSNMLRAELELPEITLDEIPTSTNEPDYDTQPYQSDSSNSETSDDTSTYDQSGVYTPNYSDPYSYEEDTYTDETYYEEPVYDETPVYDSSY